MLDVIFMGTPDFAVPSLEALCRAANVKAVATQPDKPKGRGNKIEFPDVKKAAIRLGIDVLQPDVIRGEEFLEALGKYSPDLIVVAAYGKILPSTILKLPKYGCINVHGSILPKYRGASPVQAALLNGDTKTGATIMRMDRGLDTGDIILIKEFEITQDDTGGTVFDKMAAVGAKALLEAVALIESGKVVYVPQDSSKASHCAIITKEMAQIDWKLGSKQIINFIRAYNPWPVAFSKLNGVTFKIFKAVVSQKHYTQGCGEVAETGGEGITVVTGDGAIIITELQTGSAKKMKSADYLRGHKVEIGSKFQ